MGQFVKIGISLDDLSHNQNLLLYAADFICFCAFEKWLVFSKLFACSSDKLKININVDVRHGIHVIWKVKFTSMISSEVESHLLTSFFWSGLKRVIHISTFKVVLLISICLVTFNLLSCHVDSNIGSIVSDCIDISHNVINIIGIFSTFIGLILINSSCISIARIDGLLSWSLFNYSGINLNSVILNGIDGVDIDVGVI